MSSWKDHLQSTGIVPDWPYRVRYDKEKLVQADVLVLGGGIAGCHAAINAARRGAKVVVAEKGAVKRSGAGGAGVDHWLGACTNPCSKVAPERYAQAVLDATDGYSSGIARYIEAIESWDALQDCERMGVQIRDVQDEFVGADFRDEASKLLFAYDYENRHELRVWGWNMKPSLYKEMTRLGIKIYNHITVTSLLTEGGQAGARVVGATGICARTGEFHVFQAKATIVSTGWVSRQWFFGPELTGSAVMNDMNLSGMGLAIGWNAGAEFVLMENTRPMAFRIGLGYAQYSTGNAANTYHGCPIVDVNGVEVGWYGAGGGQRLPTLPQRFRPTPATQFALGHGIGVFSQKPEYNTNHLDPGLPEKIRTGQIQLPLYADMTLLPESERRVIFGMMVGNEGKTRIPVYDVLTKAGFDPDQDLLQVPVMDPASYRHANYWAGRSSAQIRSIVAGGYLVDWNLRTSLDGLYAAGRSAFGTGAHSSAATTGRYAGRNAADHALRMAQPPVIDRPQVEREKARVLAPLRSVEGGVGWKELNAAIARAMQDYCGEHKSDQTLRAGIRILEGLAESEAISARAANPHELGRLLECFALITTGLMVMRASLERKAGSAALDFSRLDAQGVDPAQWELLIPIRCVDGQVQSRTLPKDYHLRAPYATTYAENYRAHCRLDSAVVTRQPVAALAGEAA